MCCAADQRLMCLDVCSRKRSEDRWKRSRMRRREGRRHGFYQVEHAYHHLSDCQQNDTTELQKLQTLEKHVNRCSVDRKIGDWKCALRECEVAMLTGAVLSPQIIDCKAEAFFKLHRLEDADSTITELPKLEPFPATCS